MIDKNDVINILGTGFQNIQNRQGKITIEDVEAEVINQACRYIIHNYSDQIKSVNDVNQINTVFTENIKFQPIALLFIDAASYLFPAEYDSEERKAAFKCIYSNISWAGMWDYLRGYFQKMHGESIDDVVIEPLIFYSQKHKRFQNGILVSESEVERNVNINFFNNQKEVIISIEPTLSAKKGYLLSKENNVLIFIGADPDYKFIIKLDKYNEVDEFILELPNRALKLYYY